MKFIWVYLRRYKKVLYGALVLALINQTFSLADPQIFRLIVDNYASKVGDIAQNDFVRGIIILLLTSIGVAFISRVAKSFQDYYVNVITQKLGTQMYSDSVRHSFSLPFSVFEDQRSGELLEKLQKARNDTQDLVEKLVNVLFLSIIGVLFVVIYAFVVHWMIGMVYFLIIPTLGIITYYISRGIKEAQKNVVKETTSLAGSTTETLRNVELVKSLGLDEQEVSRLNKVNEKILQLELKKIVLVRRLSFIQGTIINAIRSALLLLMLWLIYTGNITLGEMFSLFIYSFFVFNPLAELSTVAAQYQEAKASVEQLSNIMDMKPEPRPERPVTINTLKNIRFSQVYFKHKGSDRAALSGIDLEINAGETVAFVGPSGSGKTTMVKQIVGLYQPAEGTILINGQDSRTIDYDLLRSRIGLVAQDTQLFAGSIRENLLFVKPQATDETCLRAMKAAAAMPIIERGSLGLDTKIGEGGMKISGGEKQRLAIARALLRDPDLIIFDEATSSLDSVTERAITETIKEVEKYKPNLITILVAHRLSTIAHADRIYVLEKGRIVEQGSHSDLLKQGGLYSALWREQIASGNDIGSDKNHLVRATTP